MMRSKLVAAILLPAIVLPTLLLTGCGGSGETRRSTTNSANLTGLWRMQLKTAQDNLAAESNISFTVTESASGLTMTGCDNRDVIKLEKTGSTIDGLPVGLMNIANNDTMSANSDMGASKASKMATAAKFDMGTLQLSAPQLGTLNFTDLCVMSSEARVLGVLTQDNFSATTLYNGKSLMLDVAVIGNLKTGTYKLSSEPALGEATLRLKGEGLKTPLKRTELSFDKGTLTISDDTTVWLKGSFTTTMPNGSTLTGTFAFEKP